MKYRLLALDIDGTLLGSDQSISDETLDAVARAQEAGLDICLATGRSYVETIDVWRALPLKKPYQPMVLIGGALVSEAETGTTIRRSAIDPADAFDLAEALGDAGHSAMAIVDSTQYDVDYLLTMYGNAHTALRDWFSKMDVRVRKLDHLSDADDAPGMLRISTVVDDSVAQDLAADLTARFASRLNIHAIVAPNYDVTIVEAFAPQTDKLTALTEVASLHGVTMDQVAAVGDDVNDLPMVSGAGLGAAMPNATAALKASADHVIKTTLADFIDGILAGRFD